MARRRGISSFGATVVVVLILVLFTLFAWRVWTYYRLIKSGQATLPQYDSSFSVSGEKEATTLAAVGLATEDDPSIGPADAKLTVVEFLDYQCPFCNQVSSTFREAAATYGDRVRFIVRDFPVQELHPDAVTAAEAAGCAEVQGKFWPMHDRLFGLKGQMSRPDLDRAAEASGLDMPLYAACMDLHARIDEIQADAAAGVAAGVRGTPTFFFNGQPVEGAIPREAFDALIQRFLAQP